MSTIETIVVEVGAALCPFLLVLRAGGSTAAAARLYFLTLFLALVALLLTVIAENARSRSGYHASGIEMETPRYGGLG